MKIFALLASLLGFVSCAESIDQAPKAEASHAKSDIMTLQGRIAMKGSSRMRYLAIVTHGQTYKISNPNAFGLSDKQNHTLSLQAKLIKASVGPGFPAVIEVITVNK